jgi:signal transduction histidine kinase
MRNRNICPNCNELLAMISHELRTPATAIFGWAEMLAVPGIDDDTVALGLQAIKRNTSLQSKLIEQLIDYSRVNRDSFNIEPEKMDLLPVLNSAIQTMRPLARVKTITIDACLGPGPCNILGDSLRLQEVFTNLLSNAIKFSSSGGRIDVLLSSKGRFAEVSVNDKGRGISAELLPEIFQPFRQGDNAQEGGIKGLGLGLAIARHLVERHGGKISAASRGEAHGATFTVKLPLTVDS